MRFLLPIVFCLCLQVKGQEQEHFLESLTTKEGLSSNHITAMLQDERGFLWIATTDGLNRYDGKDIRHYFHYSGNDSNSLGHNYIYSLQLLPQHMIAIGTQAGLSFLDTRTNSFRNFYYNSNSALDEYNNIIALLKTDQDGNLWAASRNCIYVFDKDLDLIKIFTSPFKPADASKKRLRFVDRMIPLSTGEMLVYRFDGWFIYSARSKTGIPLRQSNHIDKLSFFGKLSSHQQKVETYFPSNNVFEVFGRYFLYIHPGKDSITLVSEDGQSFNSIKFPYNSYPYVLWTQELYAIDSSRLVFLFHNYGLAEITVKWVKDKPFLQSISSLQFRDLEFISALKDQQGNTWLATQEDGLKKLNPSKQVFKSTFLMRNGQRIQCETPSISRYQNNRWIATYGDGFYRQDIQTGKLFHYLLVSNTGDPGVNQVWNVNQMHNDTLWLGTQAGLFWYHLPSKRQGRLKNIPGKPACIDSVAITSQFTDSYGLTWIGLGKGNGVCYYDNRLKHFVHFPSNNQNYPFRYPTNIFEDNKGNLWFTSDPSHALVKFNRQKRSFDQVNLPLSPRQVSTLTSIWVEDEDEIWVGTHTSGLIRFNSRENKVKIYDHEKGIADSYVSSIYRDSKKRIWMVTHAALSVLDPGTETITNFNSRHGLPVEYPTAHFFYDPVDKRLYTAGEGAFFYFDPLAVNQPPSPGDIMITAMEINGQPYMFDRSTIQLKPSQNDITIRYAAIDLANGPDIKYQYKLLGEDTNWTIAGNQRQINFSNLGPGDYTFMVRAGNHTGTWSHNVASVQFHISKPFSKTALFYSLIVVAIGTIFYGLYKFRVRQLMRTEQMRTEISRNLHDEVGSTLTNISLGTLLVQKQLKHEPSVNKMLDRIYQDSQLVSQSMREIIWSINPKIDTVGEALPRMLQYASELLEAKNIELQAEIEPGIGRVKLSMQKRRDLYLVFKEAVNNLAKHSNATVVQVRVHVKNEKLFMLISDNGVGFDTTIPTLENGLKNMNERAKTHGWKLWVSSGPGHGTRVELEAGIA